MQQNYKCRQFVDRDETVNYIMSDAVNYHKKCTRLRTTGWERGSTGNYAKVLNLTIQPNGICTNHNAPKKIKHKIFWDIKIYTVHLIYDRRQNLEFIHQKKTCYCCILSLDGAGNLKVSAQDASAKISGSSDVVERKCVGVMKWYMKMPTWDTDRLSLESVSVCSGQSSRQIESRGRRRPSGPLAKTGWVRKRRVHCLW